MNYKTWKAWIKSKPWAFRWFIFLVLLRPVIDNFYFLKKISPLLSPLYIVGVLTPILCLSVISKYRVKPKTVIDKYFSFWSFSLLLGTLVCVLFDPFTKTGLEYLIKLTLPLYVFYFLRRFVKSVKDVDGILQTFLFSGIFVAGLLLYEVVINPIRTVESRGMERIQGNFGDVVSYGIYISFCVLIITYFYLSRAKEISKPKRVRNICIVAALALLGLFNIHHVASYGVFIIISALFTFFLLKKNPAKSFIILIVGGVILFSAGQSVIEEKVTPLLEKDIQVYNGEKDTDKLMHGRVGRWKLMWEMYTEESVISQFLGYPFSFNYSFHVVGIGAHNDFLRLMFLTGFIGLLSYIALLYQLWKRIKQIAFNQQFLAYGTLLILVLYSVSMTPTFYPNFMYLVMTVFTLVALPKKAWQNA